MVCCGVAVCYCVVLLCCDVMWLVWLVWSVCSLFVCEGEGLRVFVHACVSVCCVCVVSVCCVCV